MSEIIEMPYGDSKALTREFIKKYEEVQLDAEMKRKLCFVNSHCSLDCPSAEYEMADDRYGFGIADDMGLEKVSCKQCCYNTGRCEDCLFEHSKECPEYIDCQMEQESRQ